MTIDIIDPSKVKEEPPVFKMQDLSKEQAIELLRSINIFRLRTQINEFIKEVASGGIDIPQLICEFNLHQMFYTFVDYIFLSYDKANYFENEPERKNCTLKDILATYKYDIPPSEVKELEDLNRNDAIRLLRMVNSFRSAKIIDEFLQNIYVFGIIYSQHPEIHPNVYDIFSVFVERLFFEYGTANYFKNEPELQREIKPYGQ